MKKQPSILEALKESYKEQPMAGMDALAKKLLHGLAIRLPNDVSGDIGVQVKPSLRPNL